MILDGIKATGVVNIYDSAGNLVASNNTVLTKGKEWIAQCCTGELTLRGSHIGVGSGTSPVALTDSGLEAEIVRIPVSVPGAVTPNNKAVMRFQGVFLAGIGTGALTEAGLFTAASGGTCIARTVFPVKNKLVDDIFTIVWDITIN